MKRKELEELGLSAEVIESVMALHGQTVNDLNKTLASAEQERDQLKEQIGTNQAELDTLKESAQGNAELSAQLEEYQKKLDEAEKASKAALADRDKDFAIKLALQEAKALDESIVLTLLDRDTIKVTETGVQGLNEQLESLKTEKAFLFQAAEPDPEPGTPRIVAEGNPITPNGEVDPFRAKVEKYN